MNRKLLALFAVPAALQLHGAQAATPAPDLRAADSAPTSGYVYAYWTETITVTNQGTAPANGVLLNYAPGRPTVLPVDPGVYCHPYNSRYGRQGWGCHTFSLVAVGHSVTLRFKVNTNSPGAVNETWTASPYDGAAQLNLVSHVAAHSITVVEPPKPSTPTAVSAVQQGDTALVKWTANPAAAITSSRITLASPKSTLTGTVSGIDGTAESVAVQGVQPQTDYTVTVTNTDIAGTSPASAPITLITPRSTVKPSAPTGLYAYWYGASVAARWNASTPGDSPVDNYEMTVTVVPGDGGGGPYTVECGASTFCAQPADSNFSWTVRVRAHNAAGWSPISAPYVLNAID